MHFFDRPGRARISLRGSSSRPASSAELIAASNRARERRTQQRFRVAAAIKLQAAIRRRAAVLRALNTLPRCHPVVLLIAAGACARTPQVADALAHNPVVLECASALVADPASPLLLDAHPSVRRKALILLGAVATSLKAADQAALRNALMRCTIQLARIHEHDEELTNLLIDWKFFTLMSPGVRAACEVSDVDFLSQLRDLVDSIFVDSRSSSVHLCAQFVSSLFSIPSIASALQLNRRHTLVPRLLAGVAAFYSDNTTKDESSGPDENIDVPILLGNVLDMAHGVWRSGERGSLWSLVSAVSSLISQLPQGGNDLKGRIEDEEDGDADMEHGESSSAPFGRLVQALTDVVSEDTVRAMFNAAVSEGRPASLSVCNLFNILVNCDNSLKMSFQNALAFWRRAEGEVIGHILPRLWSMCFTPTECNMTDGTFETETRLPSQNCTVLEDCAPVLLVFARAYSHLLYVQDEDEMFEKRRPFTLDEVREISIVLKNTLYIALYSPGRLPIGNMAASENILLSNPDLFDEVSRLLSRLYICDSRRKFRTDDDFWLAGHGTLASDRFVQDAVEAGPDALVRHQSQSGYGGVRQISYASRQASVSGAGEILRVAPYLAPFSSRAKIFHKWVAEERMKFNGGALFGGMGGRRLEVRRKSIFDDAFRELKGLREQLKTTIRVKFIDEHGLDEAGIDGGGVFKEFMNEVLRQGFSPEFYGLFKKTPDGLLYPNPDYATANKDFESHFMFLGRLLGKALFDAVLVDIPFASFFLSKMLGHLNYPNDLDSLDPELYKNLKYLKNCPADIVEDLGLNFTIANNAFGQTAEVELKRGGRNIPVIAANRIEYIHRVSNYRMNIQLKRETDAFLKGFSDVIRPEFIRLFSERELQHLISGAVGRIDLEDWRINTKYSSGYSENSPVIVWFWQVMAELTVEEQSRLLTFVTSSPRAPLLGFSYLNPSFTIQRAEGDVRLPTASTCLNLLKLPNYPSLEVVREKLKYALHSNAGFDLS